MENPNNNTLQLRTADLYYSHKKRIYTVFVTKPPSLPIIQSHNDPQKEKVNSCNFTF